MMKRLIVWGSIAFLVSTSGAISQDPDVVELDEFVVTASDLYDTLGISLDPAKAPISATGISDSLNDRQGNRTLKDAVKNSAGANVATGNGIHDFFVVRGIDSLNGGLILIDGVLEPEATFYPMHPLRQLACLRLFVGFYRRMGRPSPRYRTMGARYRPHESRPVRGNGQVA